MYVCMYIYIYIYIHVFLFTYIHIFIYIHAHFLHMCIYVYAHFPNICFNINILIVFEHFMICVFDIFYFGISSPLHFMRKSGDPPYNGICPYATHPTMASWVHCLYVHIHMRHDPFNICDMTHQTWQWRLPLRLSWICYSLIYTHTYETWLIEYVRHDKCDMTFVSVPSLKLNTLQP